MKYTVLHPIIIILVLTLTGCKKDSPTKDELDQTGILGLWKFEKRFFNNIADLSVECCDYLEFYKDNQPDDLVGEFKSHGAGYETDGIFELRIDDNTIYFDFKNKQLIYSFQLNGNLLTFEYDEDGISITEDWRKEE